MHVEGDHQKIDLSPSTLHRVDEGIDTGDILLRRPVDTSHCTSVAELRAAVDDAQAKALADVVNYVARSGSLPPRQSQAFEDGRQYFVMHGDLVRVLERELQERAARPAPASAA